MRRLRAPRRCGGAPVARRLRAGARVQALCWSAALCAAAADGIPELDVERVIGHPRPKVADVGYKEPEVFDPFTDRLYQGGWRYGGPPVEIPQEVRYLSAIGRATAMKRILACADAWYYPFAHTAAKDEPPGIDIEILSRIAKKQSWDFTIMWANTGVYRGGLNLAFKQTVNRGYCDVFLGLVTGGDMDDMDKNQMVFTKPYLGIGYVLVTNGKVAPVRTLDELKGKGIKLGVPAYSPMLENAKAMGIPYESYFWNSRLIDGLIKKEIDAAMVWAPAIAVANKEKNLDLAPVPGFQPMPGQRVNGVWAVKGKETEFKQLIDDAFGEMLASGEIKAIVEKYGVPFFAPFPEAK